MEDFDLYHSGMMNADEMEQWDRVTEMMANQGEYDGYGPAQKAYDDSQGDSYAGDESECVGPQDQEFTEINDEIPF